MGESQVAGNKLFVKRSVIVGCRVYGRLSHEKPRPMGGIPSVGVFLSDPSPYLRAAIFKE